MSLYVNIEKTLGDFNLRAEFEADDGVTGLLGASGCGKSMILKCIAGIEKPDKGRIILNGTTLFDSEKKINLSPQKRRTGLMFQNYALFPNMTVKENITCGIKRERKGRCSGAKVSEIIESFGLSELSLHYPHQLSGGQQQRVALARMLVSGPEILLLDEPFSALDSHLRFRLEREVGNIIHEFGKTTLLVSHDKEETFRLTEHIAIMSRGRIDTIGTKEDVFRRPNTVNAAILTGCKNFSAIEKIDEYNLIATDWGGIKLNLTEPIGDRNYVGIRSNYIETSYFEKQINLTNIPANVSESVSDEKCSASCINVLYTTITEIIDNSFSKDLMLRPAGGTGLDLIDMTVDSSCDYAVGENIKITMPSERLLLLYR